MKPHWIVNMPRAVYYLYMKWKLPLLWEEIEMGQESVGYSIQIPIFKEDLQKPTKAVKYILKRVEQFLQQEQILIAEAPNILFEEIPSGERVRIHPFLLMKWIGEISKFFALDPKTISIGIIDGENKETDLVLDIVYPYVNYLTVFTSRLGYFMEKGEEIFADVGLNLQVNDLAKSALGDADIIIYLGKKADFPICFKRGAIFLNLIKDQGVTREVVERRPDVVVIDDVTYYYEKQAFNGMFMDLYLYTIEKAYRHYALSEKYNFEVCREVFDILEAKEVSIHTFQCMGKPLQPKVLVK